MLAEQMVTAAQLLGGGSALGEASTPDADTQGEAVEADEEDEGEADVAAERARNLRLLKMSQAEAEYAEVLSLLQVDRALLDEPERLVVLAKAAATKHQTAQANAEASTPAGDAPDGGAGPDVDELLSSCSTSFRRPCIREGVCGSARRLGAGFDGAVVGVVTRTPGRSGLKSATRPVVGEE